MDYSHGPPGVPFYRSPYPTQMAAHMAPPPPPPPASYGSSNYQGGSGTVGFSHHGGSAYQGETNTHFQGHMAQYPGGSAYQGNNNTRFQGNMAKYPAGSDNGYMTGMTGAARSYQQTGSSMYRLGQYVEQGGMSYPPPPGREFQQNMLAQQPPPSLPGIENSRSQGFGVGPSFYRGPYQQSYIHAPLPYDAGPMEDFSSRPPVPIAEAQQQLVLRASRQPYNDANAFRPMKRVLRENGVEFSELQGPKPLLGKAAGPKVPEEVNCCIFLEGLHPDTTYKDLFQSIYGKVLRSHITRPNAKHPTAAAKVGFFFRADAESMYNWIKGGNCYIRGYQVPIVKWNWDGYREEEVEHNPYTHSRVLIMKGPSHMMSMEHLERLFRSKIYFDLEDKFELPCNEIGMTRFEWRFGSVPNQAAAAKMVIEREPVFASTEFVVTYGPDPCVR